MKKNLVNYSDSEDEEPDLFEFNKLDPPKPKQKLEIEIENLRSPTLSNKIRMFIKCSFSTKF